MSWLVSFEASGEQFRPSQIHYTFTRANDPGDFSASGYYRTNPIPYGAATIEVPYHIPNEERISYLCKIIQPLLPELKRAGATDMYLSIGRFYSAQCNEAYSSEDLALMASLGCPLCYSAYRVSRKELKRLEQKYDKYPEPEDKGEK